LLGGTRGCTHVTELLWSVATAAYQTLAQYLYSHQDPAHKPFQLDGCHAWDSEGSLVQQFYPRWYSPRSDAA
jgi:NAD dependent epimerase/dehydratase family enzyme